MPDTQDLKSREVYVIGETFLGLALCIPKDMPFKEAEEAGRRMVPCGTSNGWMLPEVQEPGQCDQEAERYHIHLEC